MRPLANREGVAQAVRDGWRGWLVGCTASTVAVAAMVALLHPVRLDLGLLNVALLLLLLTVISAAAGGWVVGLYTSLLSNLAFNFFFVPPLYRFTVQEPHNALALAVFLVVAAITAALLAQRRSSAAEARRRAHEARQLLLLSRASEHEAQRRANETQTLLALSRMARDEPLGRLPTAICEAIVRDFSVRACTLYRLDGEELAPIAHAGAGTPALSRDERHVALQSRREGGTIGLGLRPAGPGGGTLRRWTEPEQIFLSLAVENNPVGVLRVCIGDEPLSKEQETLLEAFSADAAAALHRGSLAASAATAATLEASDRLKSALLSAVSHDLRTPLTAIKAAAANLLAPDIPWSDAAKREFLEAIDREADRLTRLVSNLLDLSRIEAGALRLELDWNDLEELLRNAVDRLEQSAPDHPVRVVVDQPLPLLRFDYLQIDRVVTNLLENAAKYSPASAPIDVCVRAQDDRVSVSVRDRGSGIPRAERRRVFDPFYRSLETPSGTGGSGLGLAICRGIIEAHAGSIWVDGDEGAVFTFTLPAAGCQLPIAGSAAPN